MAQRMENEPNYLLVESSHRAQAEDRLWYVMEETDLDTLKTEQTVYFGDKAYVIKAQKFCIMGNDDTWYDLP